MPFHQHSDSLLPRFSPRGDSASRYLFIEVTLRADTFHSNLRFYRGQVARRGPLGLMRLPWRVTTLQVASNLPRQVPSPSNPKARVVSQTSQTYERIQSHHPDKGQARLHRTHRHLPRDEARTRMTVQCGATSSLPVLVRTATVIERPSPAKQPEKAPYFFASFSFT